MSYILQFRDDVAKDVCDGASWYELRRGGLGQDFILEYDRALDRILLNPLAYAADSLDIRFCRMSRFPYLIFFRLRGREILVIAVVSGSCDESSWRWRV